MYKKRYRKKKKTCSKDLTVLSIRLTKWTGGRWWCCYDGNTETLLKPNLGTLEKLHKAPV